MFISFLNRSLFFSNCLIGTNTRLLTVTKINFYFEVLLQFILHSRSKTLLCISSHKQNSKNFNQFWRGRKHLYEIQTEWGHGCHQKLFLVQIRLNPRSWRFCPHHQTNINFYWKSIVTLRRQLLEGLSELTIFWHEICLIAEITHLSTSDLSLLTSTMSLEIKLSPLFFCWTARLSTLVSFSGTKPHSAHLKGALKDMLRLCCCTRVDLGKHGFPRPSPGKMCTSMCLSYKLCEYCWPRRCAFIAHGYRKNGAFRSVAQLL